MGKTFYAIIIAVACLVIGIAVFPSIKNVMGFESDAAHNGSIPTEIVSWTNDVFSVGGAGAYGDEWHSESFTPSTNSSIGGVSLKLFRDGFPGYITVSIRATDGGGQPTGVDLCGYHTNGNTLTTDNTGEWREIIFDSDANLTGGTKYAIVIRALNGDASNHAEWVTASDPYVGGYHMDSADAGATWTDNVGVCLLFETYSYQRNYLLTSTYSFLPFIFGFFILYAGYMAFKKR